MSREKSMDSVCCKISFFKIIVTQTSLLAASHISEFHRESGEQRAVASGKLSSCLDHFFWKQGDFLCAVWK